MRICQNEKDALNTKSLIIFAFDCSNLFGLALSLRQSLLRQRLLFSLKSFNVTQFDQEEFKNDNFVILPIYARKNGSHDVTDAKSARK